MTRKRWLAAGAVILLLLIVDLMRAPETQWTAKALLGAIDVYQAHLSPSLQSAGVSCRFEPSCSHYAEGAIHAKGALGGSLRALWRIARCGPWTPAGTVDLPPGESPDAAEEPPPKMLD